MNMRLENVKLTLADVKFVLPLAMAILGAGYWANGLASRVDTLERTTSDIPERVIRIEERVNAIRDTLGEVKEIVSRPRAAPAPVAIIPVPKVVPAKAKARVKKVSAANKPSRVAASPHPPFGLWVWDQAGS